MRDSATPNEECSLFLFLNSMGLEEWPSEKVRRKVLDAIRATVAIERERGKIRRAASKAAAALLLLLPLAGVAVIGSSLTACASPQTIAQIDEELVSIDAQIEALEVKEANGTLTDHEVVRLIGLRNEHWKLREARRITSPQTGPVVVADWFTRLIRGDPRAMTEAGGGIAALLALRKLKQRKRKRQPTVEAGSSAVADGEVEKALAAGASASTETPETPS